MSEIVTFLNALANALEVASAYNKQDQAAPAAVLWPDRERQWEALVPRLRARLPIFTLGAYAPAQQTGPAYWLRCIIARTIQHTGLGEREVPVLYLPGFSRQDIRAVDTCPREIQPLAELQYRGVLWTQKNGRDWTIAAFLQSRDGGLGIDVAADTATREALARSLLKLAEEPIDGLRGEAPLRAGFLDALLHPDDVKQVLRWLNDPKGFRAGATPEEWGAFVALCQSRYGFDPETDGPISAARLLGQRGGPWDKVWKRFAEAPEGYRALPDVLHQARPETTMSMLHPVESWPQENEAAESALRQRLLDLARLDSQAARRAILELEATHGQRREWVWAKVGRAPLANALGHLAALAKATAQAIAGSSVGEIAAAYATGGWRADLAALDALAAAEAAEDVAAVRTAVQAVYRQWLEAAAMAFQKAVGEGAQAYAATAPPDVPPGTCLLFTDGLRYDVAQRLKALLEEGGAETGIAAGLGALPGETATAKPAVSPAAGAFAGGASSGLDPVLATSGTKADVEVLRKALAGLGVQVLRGEDLGDSNGRAWTELGDIDDYGHEHGWRLTHHLDAELRALAGRIKTLLEYGWERVVVVTDHGWLLMPGGLPKAELLEKLTDVRKGRCARLKAGSTTDQQIVAWHWDPSVRIAVAPGIHCYEAGKEYEHGGLSPQECILPILTVRKAGAAEELVTIESVTWRGLRCNVVVKGARSGLRVDLRTKANDRTTSLVKDGKDLGADGSAALFVEDDDRAGVGAVVVVAGADGVVRAQVGTIVGSGELPR